MSEQKIRERIIEIIMESTETEERVTDETELFEDMGLSSMEIMVLVGDLEYEFCVNIPISKISNVRTVGELSDAIIRIINNIA